MPSRNAESGARGGASGSSVLRFSPALSSRSTHRRRTALLPSVLTFAVIVASGGLLLLIEKGMLNSMHTPSPLGSGKTPGYRDTPQEPAVDVDSQ
ncbi:carbohydrate sulfotransferase 14-like, partial [Clarias magur]